MRGLIAVLLALALTVLPARAALAQADALVEGADALMEALDISQWQGALDDSGANMDLGALLDDFAHGRFGDDPMAVLNMLLTLLRDALLGALPALTRVFFCSLLCVVVTRMRGSFLTDGVAEVCGFVFYLLIAIPLARDFSGMVSDGSRSIESMAQFSQSVFPTLMALLAAVGGSSSSALLKPAMLGSTTLLTTVLQRFVLPLLLFTAVVAVINNITGEPRLQRLYSLLKTVVSWTLGIAFTVFLGVITVEGAMAAVYDGITARTAKYAIDNFVPVVGGMFADTVDTLVGCSVIVKNAVGLSGMVALCALCLGPLLKIFAGVLVLRGGAALLEPVADARVVKTISDFSDVLVLLCVSIMSAAAMFFVLFTAAVASGNIATMLR